MTDIPNKYLEITDDFTLEDFLEIKEELFKEISEIKKQREDFEGDGINYQYHYVGTLIVAIEYLSYSKELYGDNLKKLKDSINGFIEYKKILSSDKVKSFIMFLNDEFEKTNESGHKIGELDPLKALEKYKNTIGDESSIHKAAVDLILYNEDIKEIIEQEDEIRQKEKEIKEILGIVDLNVNNIDEIKKIIVLNISEKEKDRRLEELINKSNRDEKKNIVSHYLNGIVQAIYLGINGLKEKNANINITNLRKNINFFGIIYDIITSDEKDKFIEFLIEEFSKKDDKGLSTGELDTKKAIAKYYKLK